MLLHVFTHFVCLLQPAVAFNVSRHGHVRSFTVKGLRNRVLDYIRQHGAISNVGETADVLGVARLSLTRILADLQA